MLAERTLAYAGVMQGIVASVMDDEGRYTLADLMDPEPEEEEEPEEEPEVDPIMASIPMEVL